MKQTGIGDRLLVEGFNLSGDVGSIQNISTPRNELPATGLDAEAEERLLGLVDVDIRYTAYYNDASGQAHPALSNLESTERLVLYGRGSTIGQASLLAQVKQIGYDGTRNSDGSLTFDIQMQGSEGNPPEWGTLLTNVVSTGTSTEATSRDDSAGTTDGLAAQLQVTARSSTGGLTVVVEDSTDDSVWATLISFTAVSSTASRAAERKTVAGTVNRYLRARPTGTRDSASFAVATRRGAGDVTY